MEVLPNLLELIDIVLKLVLAILCGGLIGIYHNYGTKVAGLPYAMLASMTSAIYVIIAFRIVIIYNLSIESLELLLFPVIIGFAVIGAANIIAQKASFQSVIQALTIWTVAGIGMAIGLGLYLTGVCAGIISFIVLNIITRFVTMKGDETQESGV